MDSSGILQFFTSSRGVDIFWAPLSVAIISGLILALILRNEGNSKQRRKNSKGLSISEVRGIIEEELKRLRPATPTQTPNIKRSGLNSKDEEGIVWGLGIGLLFLSIFYIKNQTVILDYSVTVATSLFGFWFAGVVFALFTGSLSGRGWAIYSGTVLILSLLALPILNLALHPLYAPTGITSLQHAVSTSGLLGLIKGGAGSLAFIVFQVLGFLLLYGAWLFILITLVFMSSSALVATGSKGRPVWLWLSVKTSRFSHPVKATAIVIALYGISFIFISGIAYEWWHPATNL